MPLSIALLVVRTVQMTSRTHSRAKGAWTADQRSVPLLRFAPKAAETFEQARADFEAGSIRPLHRGAIGLTRNIQCGRRYEAAAVIHDAGEGTEGFADRWTPAPAAAKIGQQLVTFFDLETGLPIAPVAFLAWRPPARGT
jgi:hypothetical protein